MECGFGAPQQHTARWIQESELAIRPKANPLSLPHKHTHVHIHSEIFKQAHPIDSRIYSIKRSITPSRKHWRWEWGNTIHALPVSNISEWFAWGSTYLWSVHERECLRMRTVHRPSWHIFSVLLMRQNTCWKAIPLPIHRSGFALYHSMPHSLRVW